MEQQQLSILVVDDDKNLLTTLSEALSLNHWCVDQANNGEEAVQMVQKKE